MATTLIISAKMAASGLLQIEVFWSKDYDVIISVHNITNKMLSRDSNYVADLAMWPKLSNSSTSMEEFIITSIL